jgi:hypothetical protein
MNSISSVRPLARPVVSVGAARLVLCTQRVVLPEPKDVPMASAALCGEEFQ